MPRSEAAAPVDSRLQGALARLVRDFSIEATPRETHHAQEWKAILAAGTRIYIPRLPKGVFTDTLEAAKRIVAAGFKAVPHLTARTIVDRRELYECLTRLIAAGVDEILVVAGSQMHATGEYESTMQLLETGAFQRARIKRIGVAGHPEDHPHVAEADLQRAIDAKNAFAATSGIDMYVVTQFFFDAAPVVAWEQRLRERGNRLPIHVGFHGTTSAASLLRYALSCGVGTSIAALGERANVLKASVDRSPDRLITAIANATLEDPSSLFEKAHFFPFGAFASTARFATELAGSRGL